MTEQDMRRLLGWTVDDTPGALVVARRLESVLRAVSTVVTFGADAASGACPPTWSVPADPDAFVDIGVVRLTGRADWVPPAAAPSALVLATQRDTWIVPPRSERPTHRLPAELLRIVAAVPARRIGRSRHAEARWTLTLTDGTHQVQLDGHWLALAWIGHLADWPEPAVGAARGSA